MKRAAAGVSSALAAAALVTASVTATASASAGSGSESATRALDPQGVARSALAAVADHPKALKAGEHQEFRVTDTIVGPDGSTHVRMNRYYKGLPVLGGDLIVHQDADGSYEGASLTLKKAPRLSIADRLRPSRVTDTAADLARRLDISKLRVRDDAKLVVDAVGQAPRLAWQITTTGIQADQTPSRMLTYIDAKTGKVLRYEETIHTAEGEGHSLYSGTVPIETTEANGGYTLTSPSYGGNYTTDAENQTDSIFCQIGIPIMCAPNTEFVDEDNVWGDGTNADRQSAAVDAQYGANMTYDYYQTVHDRAGIWGDGSGAQSRVHYGDGYVNAFWDGEKMTYGDGENNARPLTALDVAGHEMSHGVTEATAGLVYSGESGGLNEATSDIFGTAVEFHANNAEDPGDYDIGEKVDVFGDGSPLRYMYQPSLDGSSFDCWEPGIGNADVHYSSGVGNHFFFLLAEGSGETEYGTSPTCDGSSVTGIGLEAAEQIWYVALTTYMTSNTDYAGARTATLNAAADLYGEGSTEYEAVAAAWSAVNVN